MVRYCENVLLVCNKFCYVDCQCRIYEYALCGPLRFMKRQPFLVVFTWNALQEKSRIGFGINSLM